MSAVMDKYVKRLRRLLDDAHREGRESALREAVDLCTAAIHNEEGVAIVRARLRTLLRAAEEARDGE